MNKAIKLFTLIVLLILLSSSALAATRVWGDGGSYIQNTVDPAKHAIVDDGIGGAYIAVKHGITSGAISKVDPAGRIKWADFPSSPAADIWLSQAPSSIFPANDAYVITVWDPAGVPLDNEYMYVNRIASDGNYLWTPTLEAKDVSSAGGDITVDRVFSDNSGNLYILYRIDVAAVDTTNIMKIDPNGTILFDNIINTYNYTPQLDWLDDGRFFVIWNQSQVSPGDSYIQGFNFDGSPMFSPTPINRYWDDEIKKTIAISESDDGVFFVTGVGPQRHLFKKDFSGNDFPGWPVAGLNLTDGTNFPLGTYPNQIFDADSSGGLVLVYVLSDQLFVTKLDNSANPIITDKLIMDFACGECNGPLGNFDMWIDSSDNINVATIIGQGGFPWIYDKVRVAKFNSDTTLFLGWTSDSGVSTEGVGYDGIGSSTGGSFEIEGWSTFESDKLGGILVSYDKEAFFPQNNVLAQRFNEPVTPPDVLVPECFKNSVWVSCDTVYLNDTIEQVRANCTDVEDNVASVKFILSDPTSPISVQRFNTVTTVNDGADNWVLDNVDVLLNQIGNWNLSATCTDDTYLDGYAEISWPVGNTPPIARIISPSDEGVYVQGANVNFLGEGIDAEDGILTGMQLQWTSNVNGSIGTGQNFNLTTLSTGFHLITLTVTDLDSVNPLMDNDSVTIEIQPISANTPPSISLASYNFGSEAEALLPGNSFPDVPPLLQWNYFDGDADLQKDYFVKVWQKNGMLWSDIINTGWIVSVDDFFQALQLGNGTYYWEVQVKDAQDESSGWSEQGYFAISSAILPPPPSGSLIISDMRVEPFASEIVGIITIFTTVRNASSNTLPLVELELTPGFNCPSIPLVADSFTNLGPRQTHTFENTIDLTACGAIISDGEYWVNAKAFTSTDETTHRALFTVKEIEVLAVTEIHLILVLAIALIVLYVINSRKKH